MVSFLPVPTTSVERCQERMAAVPASVFVFSGTFLLKHICLHSVFHPIDD